jgi:hypothetical protein
MGQLNIRLPKGIDEAAVKHKLKTAAAKKGVSANKLLVNFILKTIK